MGDTRKIINTSPSSKSSKSIGKSKNSTKITKHVHYHAPLKSRVRNSETQTPKRGLNCKQNFSQTEESDFYNSKSINDDVDFSFKLQKLAVDQVNFKFMVDEMVKLWHKLLSMPNSKSDEANGLKFKIQKRLMLKKKDRFLLSSKNSYSPIKYIVSAFQEKHSAIDFNVERFASLLFD